MNLPILKRNKLQALAGIALSVLLAGVSPSIAETFRLDGVSMNLELPKGYCALQRSQPAEKLFLDQQDRMQKGTNSVIQVAVLCSRQQAFRDRKLVYERAMWLMNTPDGKPAILPEGMTRAGFIAEMAKTLPTLDINKINADTDKSGKKEGVKLQINSSGTIDQNDDALYEGLVVRAERGSLASDVAVVTAVTTIAGHIVTLNLYADYVDRTSFDGLLASAKETLRRTVSANGAAAPPKSLPPGMAPVGQGNPQKK